MNVNLRQKKLFNNFMTLLEVMFIYNLIIAFYKVRMVFITVTLM